MIFQTFGWPQFWFLVGSLQWTVVLTALALGGGGIIGFGMALARVSRWPARASSTKPISDATEVFFTTWTAKPTVDGSAMRRAWGRIT